MPALGKVLPLFLSLAHPAGQPQGQESPPVMMVDELLILNPHQLSFSEAGLRIMITPHFSPRTRLRMAGRMLISEVVDSGWRNISNVSHYEALISFLPHRDRG